MGAFKPTFKKCPGCNQFSLPTKDSKSRVGLRFRIAGKDVEYCESCSARERFKLQQWLMTENKSIRTVPMFDPKTRRRTLVVLTDPQDYVEDPNASTEGPNQNTVGEEGLLLAPSAEDVAKLSKPD